MTFLPLPEGAPGDRIAIEDDQGLITFQELHRQVDLVAGMFREAGVVPGMTVGFLGRLNRTQIMALHATWRVGGVVAPFHPSWTLEENRRAFSALRPGLALVGSGVSPETVGLAAQSGLSVLRLEEILGLQPTGDPSGPQAGTSPDFGGPGPGARRVARLLTSGTGGEPNTVEITAENFLASAKGARNRLGLGARDRWLGSLAIAHVGGLALVTRAAWVGSRLVLAGSFDAAGVRNLIKAGRVSHASLVPVMLRRLLASWGPEAPPESLRCLLVGGAGTPADLREEALERGFPIALTYGLSEASSQVATAPPPLVRKKPGTVGPPLDGAEVRIGSDGTIHVRGPMVVPGKGNAEGWLETGDLGTLDEDGDLWVTGRAAHRIITGGLTVDPGEVEAVLRRHPSIEDAAVVGVPDPEWGERLVAAVVVSGTESPAPGVLEDFVRIRLSPGKRPRAYRFVRALPRNSNGKVHRSRLRRLFKETEGPWSGSSSPSKVPNR